MGPDPWKSVSCLAVVSFHPNVPASGSRLPSVAMVSLRLDRKARQTLTSEATCE
jgi:hypothetical protein